MILCFFILYALFLYVPSKQALQMFQQNRYRYDRYHIWLKQQIQHAYKKIAMMMFVLMISYSLFLLPQGHVPQFLLAALMLIFLYVTYKQEQQQTYRKPLKSTSRVQRLWACLYALYVLIILTILMLTDVWFWILMTPFLYGLPWVIIMLAGAMMNPLEQQIQYHYMRQAKQLLQNARNLNIIGITGSYGKTSVKNILFHMLSMEKMTLMTPKSYNNRMGITLTIREQLQPLHEIFLCEMGADHVHEIEQLMDFVKPSIGIVCAVGPQHLQTFKTMEAILHEKMQMIERLPMHGTGFLNADDHYIRSYPLRDTCRIIWYGQDYIADYRICDIRYSKTGTNFAVVHEGQRYQFHTVLLGEHNIMNITCGIAVASTLGIAWQTLQKAIERLPYVEHRLAKIDSNAYTILDDAYNANPQGARYALDVLSQMEGRRFLVTPGFIDLGERQDFENYQLGNAIMGCADEVILVGQHQSASIYRGLIDAGFPETYLHVVDQLDQAFHLLYELAKPCDVVLLENDLPDAFNH